MRQLTLALAMLLSLTTLGLNAQKSSWKDGKNEINIGIKPFSLKTNGIQYKGKISNKNWVRIGVPQLNLREGTTGLRLGVEKQQNLALRSRITYGLEAGTFIDYDRFDNAMETYFDLGIPVGVQMHLSKRFLLGIESRPSIGLYESYIDDEGIRIRDFSPGIDFFTGYRLALGYRF